MSNYEKSEEIIYLLSLLHNKTTSYKDIDIDEYKKIYEDIFNKLNELEEYYISLNNEIDKEIYMSPSNYLLVRNITKIYSAIYYCKTQLEEFYNITSIDDFEEVFDTIARQKGLLQKGGVPNYDRVIDLIINDIKSGKIKDITFDRISYE